MTAEITFVSRYDRRVKLVQGVVHRHAKLGDETAAEIAVEVLRALDMIPETVR